MDRSRLKARVVRHPVAFLVARMLVWSVRTARMHVLAVGIYGGAFVALLAAGFFPSLDPFGKLGWVGASLMLLAAIVVMIVGFVGFLLEESRPPAVHPLQPPAPMKPAKPSAMAAKVRAIAAQQEADATRLGQSIAELAERQRADGAAVEARLLRIVSAHASSPASGPEGK